MVTVPFGVQVYHGVQEYRVHDNADALQMNCQRFSSSFAMDGLNSVTINLSCIFIYFFFI